MPKKGREDDGFGGWKERSYDVTRAPSGRIKVGTGGFEGRWVFGPVRKVLDGEETKFGRSPKGRVSLSSGFRNVTGLPSSHIKGQERLDGRNKGDEN